MPKKTQTHPTVFAMRRAYSFEYLLNFYISSIVALLGTRFYLDVLGYPIIGGQTLHISHALVGGIFMGAALFVQMLFIGRRISQVSSIIGGIGFGLFIDEVGKLVTRDYDYFYQPAVVIIYFLYLGLFALLYKIRYATPLTPEEQKANADIDVEAQTGIVWKLQLAMHQKYKQLVIQPKFQVGIQWMLYVYAGVVFINTIRIMAFNRTTLEGLMSFGQLISNLIAAGCIVYGVTQLKISRKIAYVWYQRAILIWIFFTQVFVFYEDQFSAVFYLGISVLLFAGVRYARDEEKLIKTEKARARASN